MRLEPAALPADTRVVLDSEILKLSMLQDVVRWAFALTPPSNVSDVIVQDEFTHDVVIPWRQSLHLVFDTT